MALLYRLGRAWRGRQGGWLSAALWGLSPLVVLYGRMARYYSLGALLGLLSTCALLYAVTRMGWRRWIAYVVISSTALYTFYLTGLLLPVHGWLSFQLKRKRALFRWLASIFLVALGLLPWSGVVAGQAIRTGSGVADLTYSIAGIAMKIVYPAYALALGESLFPWHPIAVVGGAAVVLLFFLGVVRWREQALRSPLLALLLFPLVGMILVTTLVSPRTPFVSLPARTLFAAPYFYLILGGGFGGSRARLIGPVALALVAAWSLSLANYYRNQQFLNPIYLTPARQLVRQVLGRLQPGDVILSPDDSGFGYYYEQSGARQPHFDNSDRALDYLERNEVERVWIVVLGRDQTRRSASVPIQEWLQTHFRLAGSWGYVPQDSTYRAIKSRLLGRQAYEYRATLSLYVRTDRGALGVCPGRVAVS